MKSFSVSTRLKAAAASVAVLLALVTTFVVARRGPVAEDAKAQAGSGGIARLVGDSPSTTAHVVNVLDFGAVPDCNPGNGEGTDCTAAFQAAIDALPAYEGGSVRVPFGKYKITAALRIYNNVASGRRRSILIEGECVSRHGIDKNHGSVLCWCGDDTGSMIELFSRNCVLRGLQLCAAGPKTLNAAVSMTLPKDPDGIVTANWFDRVFVNGQVGQVRKGVWTGQGGIANNEHHRFDGCLFLDCLDSGVHLDNGTGQAKYIVFNDTQFVGGGSPVKVAGIASPQFHDCNFSGCKQPVIIRGSFEPVTFRGCDSEGMKKLVEFGGGVLKFDGCRFSLDQIDLGVTVIEGADTIIFDACVLNQNVGNRAFFIRPNSGGTVQARASFFGYGEFMPKSPDADGANADWSLHLCGCTAPDITLPDGVFRQGYSYSRRLVLGSQVDFSTSNEPISTPGRGPAARLTMDRDTNKARWFRVPE